MHSPLAAGQDALVSKDRRSVMIQYTPKGTNEEATLYIDKLVAAVEQVGGPHAGLTLDSVGVSTDVHVLLGRDDARRRGRDARLADRPARRAVQARRPSAEGSAVAATALLLTLAAPPLGLHTSQTGMEGITSAAVDPFKKFVKAFPGSPDPAVVAIKGDVESARFAPRSPS